MTKKISKSLQLNARTGKCRTVIGYQSSWKLIFFRLTDGLLIYLSSTIWLWSKHRVLLMTLTESVYCQLPADWFVFVLFLGVLLLWCSFIVLILISSIWQQTFSYLLVPLYSSHESWGEHYLRRNLSGAPFPSDAKPHPTPTDSARFLSLASQIKRMTYDSGPISIWVLASEQRKGAEGQS